PANLAPGAHFDCTGTYTVTQADMDAGHVTNVATATATYAEHGDTNSKDRESVVAEQNNELTLDKSSTDTSYSAVGGHLHYTYALMNAGNVTLHAAYDIDHNLIGDAHSDCSNGPANLAPGAQFDCTGTYTVTQADMDAGHITNVATATATFAEPGDTKS